MPPFQRHMCRRPSLFHRGCQLNHGKATTASVEALEEIPGVEMPGVAMPGLQMLGVEILGLEMAGANLHGELKVPVHGKEVRARRTCHSKGMSMCQRKLAPVCECRGFLSCFDRVILNPEQIMSQICRKSSGVFKSL